MNKLLPALILQLAFSAFSASAQKSTYQQTYIIQHTDTIHGYINSGSDLQLSKAIQFKKDLNSEAATTLKPGEIEGFGFKDSGFYYASIKADIRKDSSAWQTERFVKWIIR